MKSTIPLEDLLATCEALYARQGYVRWSQVALAYGVSRQAIQLRLRAAVATGRLTEDLYRRWQTPSSVSATAREAGEGGATVPERQARFQISAPHEDAQWLRTEAAASGLRPSDVLYGLLRQARCAASKGVN